MKSAKSLGFCFKLGKEKTKQKDFAMCVAESKHWFAPVLFIAKTLWCIYTKRKNETKLRQIFCNYHAFGKLWESEKRN